MGVDVSGDRNRRMPQTPRHLRQRFTGLQPDRGGGVTKIVQPDHRQSQPLREHGEAAGYRSRIERLPVVVVEDRLLTSPALCRVVGGQEAGGVTVQMNRAVSSGRTSVPRAPGVLR